MRSRVDVISPGIPEALHDAITREQIAELTTIIRGLLKGHEHTALDYGCGAGRFTPMMAELVGHATGFDPSADYIRQAPPGPDYVTCDPRTFLADLRERNRSFDVVFVYAVLGGIAIEHLLAVIADLVRVLSPNGLFILADHMPDVPPVGTFWRFRPMAVYADLLAQEGIELRKVGSFMQHYHRIDVTAGYRFG